MLFVILIALFILAICLIKPKNAPIILSVVTAILYFPIGIILALAKNYK